MAAVIVLSPSEFAALNGRLNVAFGYPTADGATLTYAKPQANPDNANEVAMFISESALPHLTMDETIALQDSSVIASWTRRS